MSKTNEEEFINAANQHISAGLSASSLIQSPDSLILFFNILKNRSNYNLCSKILDSVKSNDESILSIISSCSDVFSAAFSFLENYDLECSFVIPRICDLFYNAFISSPINFFQTLRFTKNGLFSLFKNLDNNEIFFCMQHCSESTELNNPYFYYSILAALDSKCFQRHKGVFLEALVFGEPDFIESNCELKLTRLHKERLIKLLNGFLIKSKIVSTVFSVIDEFFNDKELDLDIDLILTIATHFDTNEHLFNASFDAVKNGEKTDTIETALLYLQGAKIGNKGIEELLDEKKIGVLLESVFMREKVRALHMKILTNIIKYCEIRKVVPSLKKLIPKAWNRKIVSLRPFVIELADEFRESLNDVYPSFFESVVDPYKEDKPYKRSFAFK